MARGVLPSAIFDCSRPTCLAILFPTWSPDGARILFTLFPAPLTSQVAAIDADGFNLRLLTNPSLKACCAAWQPLPARGSNPASNPLPLSTMLPSISGLGTAAGCIYSEASGDFDGDGRSDHVSLYPAVSPGSAGPCDFGSPIHITR
jgi:hypothetical protein